jgi:hypothetical protein
MPNQEQSPNGIPSTEADRPSPDTGRAVGRVAGGQASGRGTGDAEPGSKPMDRPMAGDEKGMPLAGADAGSQDYRGDGPGKIGITSDNQPDLVEGGGVNARNHQERGDAPVAGDTLNFDDGTDMVHPRQGDGRGPHARREEPQRCRRPRRAERRHVRSERAE